ncbi:putative ran bp2 nzf zinc finger-like protein [Golovinomyces cichoracearum]|uniref:Putative ran bp2 nzf zinc finger-like protein n=1 Tax=Golovinomyces cichoracearum TaxID=62708 RepID=A0A420HAZ1_9PEZI|nr:putative ran bp2 nzf zinc finger-like protein [Golovinomyces cichoracearum]
MPSMGLDRSKWANHQSQPSYSRGDWTCSLCRTRNYYWREKCEKCCRFRHVVKQNLSTPTTSALCQSHIPTVKQQNYPVAYPVQFSAINSNAGACPTLNKSFLSESERKESMSMRESCNQLEIPGLKHVINEPTILSKNLNLSLPFQVQHYVLKLMEKMLEDSCYDFALRWIPERLNEVGCDCPEAFELAKWRTFLPLEIPFHAFSTKHSQSISNALTNAVKIRNAAVHRHQCDIYTVRDMIKQAEELMYVLSDQTRQEKLNRLWYELGEWGNNSNDLGAARAKLEQALQTITDGPVDDMDWTPNPVSIEGINETALTHSKDYGNEMMDIDDI